MPSYNLGTMGFSYAEWAGVFYPRGMKAGEYLAHYAAHFDAVELDTTFHAVPPVERVRRWAGMVPEGFRFSVKTPRAVTHDAPLDRGVDSMRAFLDVVAEFGAKLAVVLLQFPPSFSRREAGRFDAFLTAMPKGVRFAAEFRHPSWRVADTEQLLRAHDVAWVSVDYEGERAEVRPTAGFLYVRWIGAHDRFPEKDMEQLDMTDRLEWWKGRIEEKGEGVKEAYGFFNNDYAGYSVATCNRFKGMVGLPVRETVAEAAQGKLFE